MTPIYQHAISTCSVSLDEKTKVSLNCQSSISLQLKRHKIIDRQIYFIHDGISFNNESYIDEYGNIKFYIALSENEDDCIIRRDLTVTLLIKHVHECLRKDTINETLEFLLQKKNKQLKLDRVTYFLDPVKLKFSDDVGLKFVNFDRTLKLDICKIPDNLLQLEYKLVGTSHYAPYSKTKNIYCILYAELDNKFDQHAIKVLRWNPTRLDESNIKSLYAHELGYISKDENELLHTAMVNLDNRILIGYLEHSLSIKILGGYEVFRLDGCLKDFVLPCFITNHIK